MGAITHSWADTDEGEGLDDPRALAQRARVEARLFGGSPQTVMVGRFALGSVLGSGAMGVVHRGYDDVLDRDVAIKLIPTRSSEGSSGSEAERLFLEAQAMARVSHGNVVHVYEAGSYARGVFVAMELVEGQTLREWLHGEGKDRPWRERLDTVVAAGRGLAHAHDAGVIHRDFKPENVLLTAGGVAKVSDFGLAGLVDATAALEETAVDLHTLSRTAAAVGTPLYMAPEVFEGQPANARSDQFGFCVTAYEAVYGRRPFEAPTLEALRLRVSSGELPSVPGVAVDRMVARAIARGLAVDPAERWPSMDALLTALAPERRGLGWRALLGGGVLIGGLAVAGTLLMMSPETSPCGDGSEAMGEVWGDRRRAALEAAMQARELPFAPNTFGRIAPRLDAYAERWREAHVAVCEQRRHEPDSALARGRQRCLGRQRTQLDAAVERLLDHEDMDAAIHAEAIIDALPPVDACDDPPTVIDDPAQRRATDAVTEALAESVVRRAAGEHQRAAERARVAIERAQQVEDAGLRAEAWYALGRAHDGLARYQDAERSYSEAQRRALEGSRWELAADACSALALASAQHDYSRVPQAHLDVAHGLAKRGISPPAHARLSRRVGAVHYVQGRYPEAIAAFESAVEAWEQLGEAGVRSGLETRWDLGRALAADGQLERAEQVQRRALDRTIELYGAEHPLVAHGHTTLSLLLVQTGQLDGSLAEIERAVELGRRSMPGHPDVAMAEATKAGLLMAHARYDEAIADLLHLQERWSPTLPAGHPTMLTITANLGAALLNRGHVERAEPLLRGVVDASIAAYGAEHPKTATSRAQWATSLQLSGRHADAEREYRSAMALAERLSGPRSARVGRLRASLAGVVADLGRDEEALLHYEAAVSILSEALDPSHREVTRVRANAATVLVSLGRLAEAEREYERVLSAMERTLPPAHPHLINTLANLGDTRLRQGQHAKALEVLERAVGLLDRTECPPGIAARARHALVEALVEGGGARPRIAALVEQALADYAQLPAAEAEQAIAALRELAR